MGDETLLTAAHRLLERGFRVDAEHGGMITDTTLRMHEMLDRQITLAEARGERSDLLVAARGAATAFHLDATRHGGLISIKTEIAFDTLTRRSGRPADVSWRR